MTYTVTGFETDWTKKEVMGAVLSEREAIRVLKSGERPVIQCREEGTNFLVASAYAGTSWTLTTGKGESVTVSRSGVKALVNLLLVLGAENDREATLTLDGDLELARVVPGEKKAAYSFLRGKVTTAVKKEAFLLASTFLLGERLQKDLGVGQWTS